MLQFQRLPLGFQQSGLAGRQQGIEVRLDDGHGKLALAQRKL